jgi:hypothetical protein
MSNSQFYFLIGFYLYLNFFLSITLIKENFTTNKKVIALIALWIFPFIGYLSIAFILTKKDVWNKILNFSLIVLIYSILFTLFF